MKRSSKEEKKEITERFLKFWNYLLAAGIVKNEAELKKKTKIGNMISEMKEKRSNVGALTLFRTIKAFPQLNCNWLFHNKGSMLIDDLTTSESDARTIVTVNKDGHRNVIFVNTKAAAGYLNAYGDPEFIAELPAFNLPELSKGDYRMFEVDGESMYPTLHHGDMVVCQATSRSNIKNSELYVVVTQQHGLLVKRIFNEVKKKGILLLKSDNKLNGTKYRDIPVNAEEILELWKVVRRIIKQPDTHATIHSTIDELKARLALLEEQVKQSNR